MSQTLFREGLLQHKATSLTGIKGCHREPAPTRVSPEVSQLIILIQGSQPPSTSGDPNTDLL